MEFSELGCVEFFVDLFGHEVSSVDSTSPFAQGYLVKSLRSVARRVVHERWGVTALGWRVLRGLPRESRGAKRFV